MRAHRAPPRTPTTRTVCNATRACHTTRRRRATRRRHVTIMRRACKIMRVRHVRCPAPTPRSVHRTTRARRMPRRARTQRRIRRQRHMPNAARLLPRHEPATNPRRNNTRPGSLAARSQPANRAASANALRWNSRQPKKGSLVQNARAPFLFYCRARKPFHTRFETTEAPCVTVKILC
jgi:hypothetical protein